MFLKEILKRFLPFAAALVTGLFVASFFISVAAPSFNYNYKRNEYSGRSCWKQKTMRHENRRLREELRREQMRNRYNQSENLENLVPPPPPIAPAVSR